MNRIPRRRWLTWATMALLTCTVAACGSGDSSKPDTDPGSPSPFSAVTDQVMYKGLDTPANLTAENVDDLTAGALGFDILGTSPETKALTDTTNLLTGRDDESLSLAELFESLPSSAAGESKEPSGGYGGLSGYEGFLYDTVTLELEAPDELLKMVLEKGFPNLSSNESFAQNTALVLDEAAKTATFTTTLTFTDCTHCTDDDFSGTDPAQCDELIRLNSTSAQIITTVDIKGIMSGELDEIRAMQGSHPEIALTRLLSGTYLGRSAFGNTYIFPYTCTLAYSGDVAVSETDDGLDTPSYTNTLSGTFASSMGRTINAPLDTDFSEGYGGYVTSYGYGGETFTHKTTFEGAIALKRSDEPARIKRSKSPSPDTGELTIAVTIPQTGKIVKDFRSSHITNTYNPKHLEIINSESQEITLDGAVQMSLSWVQPGVEGSLSLSTTTGGIKESWSPTANLFDRKTRDGGSVSEEEAHNKYSTIGYEIHGDATLDATLAANLLSPVTQSLKLEMKNGSLLYASNGSTHDHSYASDAAGTVTLNTIRSTGSDCDLSLSGRTTLVSGDNHFLFNGAMGLVQTNGYHKIDTLITNPAYRGDNYDEQHITATDVTIQSNGIDLCLEGSYTSREGTWWNGDTETVGGGEGVTTTDLDLVFVNNLTKESSWFNGYHLVTTDIPGTPADYPLLYDHHSTVLTGRYYHSAFGYVDVATKEGAPLLTFDLSNYPGYVFPTYGEVVITGSGGNTASLIPLKTVVNQTNPTVQRIPVPDGYKMVFGGTETEYRWPDPGAMLSQNWLYRLIPIAEFVFSVAQSDGPS